MRPLQALTRLAPVLAALLTLHGGAQAQTEWKFNNSYAPSRPESAHIRAFAADVEKRTGGKLKVSVSEGGSLGLKDADALRFMQAGTPELSFICRICSRVASSRAEDSLSGCSACQEDRI